MFQAPALFFACNLLLGCGFAIHPHWVYVPILVLFWKNCSLQKALMGLTLALAAYGYTWYRMPGKIPEGNVFGVLSIDSIRPSVSPFHHSLLYRAHFNGIPCNLFFPKQKNPLSAKWDYFVEGRLIPKEHGIPAFKPNKKTFAPILSKERYLVRWRFKQKERLRCFLSSKIKEPKVFHFISALLTGDVDDRQLTLEFRKVGLSHLLVISGFHFALLATCFGYVLRRFLSQRLSSSVLLVLMSGYFIFLGVTPSILRAFVTIFLFLVAELFNFQQRPLNLIGAALIVEILYDPLVVEQVGFQLTFLCTVGLLLFFQRLELFFRHLFPKRSLETMHALPFFDRQIAKIAGFLRQALAANVAAHLLALPVCLYHFHSFPFLSLLYNLFFPLGCSVSLILCCISLMLGPFGGWIYCVNTSYTDFLLRLISAAPPLLDRTLLVASFPFSLLLLFLAGMLWLGLDQKARLEAKC